MFRRIISYIIDFTILFVLLAVFTTSARVFYSNIDTFNQGNMMGISAIITMLIFTSYIPTKTNGQTIGMIITNIKVINMNGKPRTYFQNFIREGVTKFTFSIFFIVLSIVYYVYDYVIHKEFSNYLIIDTILRTNVIRK
jgi:uncharacterized RDD family membrane protein YckC